MPIRPEDIPRRQERLILADATQKFERLLIKRMFAADDIAVFAELAYLARPLWSATLREADEWRYACMSRLFVPVPVAARYSRARGGIRRIQLCHAG